MDFITQTLNGLGLGSIYALVALGYSMVYGIVQLINFAHGDIIMVGGYVVLLMMVTMGLPLWMAVIGSVLFCALAGVLWYSQFFGLGMGKSFFAEAPLMLAFSWSILMSLNVLFSNLWGILLHEWRGVDRRTAAVLVTGLLILIFSTVYPQLVK